MRYFNKAMLVASAALCLNLSAFSQNITLKTGNVTVKEAMEQLKKSSGYSFVFSSEDLDTRKQVSISVQNGKIEDAVKQILAGQEGLNYEVKGKNIVIKKEPSQSSSQQKKKVTGQVIDASGVPVIGATVMEKGTANGTITDFDGNFTLDVSGNAPLEISYIGYKSQELKPVVGRSLSVTLREDTEVLEEVVVVGYGTVKKGNLTTSVSSIKAETLENRPVQSVTEALQGQVAGLNVTSSGRPGEAAKMQLRGATSLNESGSPLVLIDGVPGEFDYLNVDDIDNVTVLKDAASAAIYGSRAAHGVILVTTKRGKSGKPIFQYNGSVGINTPTDMPKLMSSSVFATVINEAYRNNGGADIYFPEDIQKFADGSDLNRYPNTNWIDLAFQNSITTRHSIAASGGTESVKYHLSAGYDYQTGVIPEISQNIYNIRSNIDVAVNKRLDISFDIRYTQRKKDEVVGFNSIIEDIYKMDPTDVAYYTDGTYGYNAGLIINPLAYLHERGHGYTDRHDANGIFKLNYKILDGLTFTGIANVNYVFDNVSTENRKIYFTDYFTKDVYENGVNSLEEKRDYKEYFNLQALLNYKKSFGKHNLDVLAGFQAESEKTNNIAAFRDGYPTDLVYVLDAGAKDNWSNEGTAEHWSLASVIGRVNYDFDDKYLLSASFRSDGSSYFSKGNRWSTFPTVSAAWRVTKESFMESISGFLDDLKLRASWGIAGASSGLDLYPAYTTISMGNVVLNNVYGQSAYLKSVGNEDLGWEKTYMFDIGLDLRMFNNRLGFVFDYYNKDTKDILIALPVPMEYGLGNPKTNIGEVENRGWELELSWNDRINDFSYGITANLSDNKNEVKSIGGTNPWINGSKYTAVGYPMNSIYGYESMGLFQSKQEIEDAPFQNVKNAPGDVRYVNQNGDDKIDGDDRVVIGDPNPHYLFGLRLNGEYKGFDLSVFFQGIGKKDYIMSGPGVRPFNDAPLMEQHMDYWSESNTDARYPRVLPNAEGNFNYETSDFWKINGGYLRLKNLQVGYKLPKKWLSFAGISYARIYFSANNLFTIDNFVPGYDPETENAFTYPLAKTYSFGLNIQF